jgi:c-di-GMP-binding flagellar brake protein YcgR
MKNRRKAPRFNIPVKVEYRNLDLDTPKYPGLCKDINLSGLCLVAQEPVNKDQLLDIDLYFPDNSFCQASGRVVWQTNSGIDYRAGISFTDMKNSVKTYILNYIFDHVEDEFNKKS